MSPLALCSFNARDDASAVVETGRWLTRVGGFDVCFAYTAGPPLEHPVVMRIRDGVARAEMPSLGTLAASEALECATAAAEAARSARLTENADLHVIGGSGPRPLGRLTRELAADLVVIAADGAVPREASGGYPMLLAPSRVARGGGPIICALGPADDRRESTVATAVRLARRFDRPLVLVHVLSASSRGHARAVAERELGTLAQGHRLRSPCTTIVLEGSVLAELDALASQTRADLLVVGRGHRRALVPRFCRPAAAHLAARTARRVVIAPREAGRPDHR